MRKLVLLVVTFAALLVAPAVANAEIADVFDGDVTCTTQGAGPSEGQRWCGTGQHNANNGTRSTVASFDGVPIDVNVAFPDITEFGDGPFPLVYIFHGYGGGKINFPSMQRWLNKGYAVFSQTNRGFHESCGTATSKLAAPICNTEGFVRLNDTRYEVRDAQTFAGTLVDEGLVQPTRIAATGGSYGGGMSMALAALKDRVMEEDGSLVAWESPMGTPMSLAVAIPNIPWTDLAYSLVPNGSNIDYIKDASYYGRFGVMKQSYVNGLYLSGLLAPGYYTAPGLQPSADLTGWKAFMDLGEPYDGEAQAEQMIDEVTTYHSSYYIDHSQSPAPLLISSGYTDDLFPANEATRFYNRTRAEYPESPLGLFFGSFGHMRGQNGSEVTAALRDVEDDWVDHYLTDIGTEPESNVIAYSQVCPNEDPDGGPYVSEDWASAAPGEIRLRIEDGSSQTVAANGGDRAVGATFNPAPAGTACATAAGAKETGTANYEFEPAPAGGYTINGSPTVVAKITQSGDNSQLAARLVDVSPDGTTKTLVNRGLWRPANTGFQVFQLTPNAWTVEEGHVLRLELLPFDGGDANPTAQLANYGRPSNGQQNATIEKLDLRIPVIEAPGALGGLVTAPAKKVLPDRPGVELAIGYEAIGSQTLAEYANEAEPPCPTGWTGTFPDCVAPDPPTPVVGNPSQVGPLKVKGKMLTTKLTCKIGNDSCRKATLIIKGAPKKGKKGKKLLVVKKSGLVVSKPGQTKTFRIKLTSKARKFFKDSKVRKRGKKKTVRGPKTLRSKVIVNNKFQGFKTVKRVGKVK